MVIKLPISCFPFDGIPVQWQAVDRLDCSAASQDWSMQTVLVAIFNTIVAAIVLAFVGRGVLA